MTTCSILAPDCRPRSRVETRSTRAFSLAVAIACALVACGEHTQGPPTEPTETEPPPGSNSDPPGLNPEPLEDVCDPPPPSVAGLGPVIWGVPEKVPVPFDSSFAPALAADERGVYLAFEVHGPDPGGPLPIGPTDVYVVRREGVEWSDPVNISRSPTASSRVRLFIDALGIVHALWGERIGYGSLVNPASVFHSTAAGGGWSTPDTVWFGTGAAAVGMPNRMVSDPSGRIHIVMTPGIDETNANDPEARKFVHLVWERGSWSSPHTVYYGGEADLVIDSSGHLLAVYVTGDPRGGESNRDVNSVFFTRSDDGGVTWSWPQRIVRGGREAAHDPRIIIAGDERIHVIWTRATEQSGIMPVKIEHSYSTDGVCWSDPIEVTPSLSGFPLISEVVPDDGGGLHLIFHHQRGGLGGRPFRAMYVYWDGFSWGDPFPLFGAEEVGLTIGVARDPGGTLHVALAGEVGGERGIYYATGRATGAH